MARLVGICTGHKWPPIRQTANRHRPARLLHYCTRPAYLMRHGPFLARLVFSNETARGAPLCSTERREQRPPPPWVGQQNSPRQRRQGPASTATLEQQSGI